MSAERPVDAVQWHQGMLLSPQHFQLASRRAEGFAAYHSAAIAPFHWGVSTLRIDESLLTASGIVRIVELDAIFPDGLLAFHGRNDDSLELDLGLHRAALESGPLMIHLAVAARGGETGSGDMARYRSVEGPPTADENTGEDPQIIPRLKPRLRLLAGPTPPAKFVSFPILQIALRDENYVRCDFEPPCPILAAESGLAMIIDQLTRRIREKAIFLAERSRSPSASAGEALVQETQSVIRGLVAALPPLEALLASNAAPPFAVYLALAGLTGHLAGLGAGQIPPVPPRYRHDDLLASFLPLIEFSLRRIDGIQMQYREMAFTQSEPGSFTLTLQPSWMRPRLIIGARRPAGAEHSAMAAWFARAFIASADQLPRLAELRILGAKRARIDRDDELGVIPSERLTLFAIDLDPTFIRANQALTIAARADGETSMLPVELVLFIATAGEEK